jgi:DNA polymerase III beta subunit, central domain
MSENTTQHPESLIFNVSASAVRAAASCMAKCDLRYYLNGVFIEPHTEGVTITATNGHMLFSIIDRTGYVKAPVICSIPKHVKKSLPLRHIMDDGRSHRLLLIDAPQASKQAMTLTRVADSTEIVTDLSEHIVDAIFPDWRKAIRKAPEVTTPVTGLLNAKYVAAITKGFEKDRSMAFKAYQDGDENETFFWFQDMPEAIACIMPITCKHGLQTEFDKWRDTWAEIIKPKDPQPTTEAQEQATGAQA